MAKLYIMGCGGFGTALAVMFSNVGHDVTLWGWMKSENDELRKHRENIPLLKGSPFFGGVACAPLRYAAAFPLAIRIRSFHQK